MPHLLSYIQTAVASFIVKRIAPYHRNFGKRLVKAPKLYFLDTGLCAWLLGISSERDLQTHYARGALFETWAVTEALKWRAVGRGHAQPTHNAVLYGGDLSARRTDAELVGWWGGVMWCWLGELYLAMHKAIPRLIWRPILPVSSLLQENTQMHMPEVGCRDWLLVVGCSPRTESSPHSRST